ncbi:MAG: hypothetical protein L3J95_04060 [Thermoplasmata archaeon]|nr:hypothetical protein [Thermoplasmata archaeon]MCI4359582.1 hypothetical protein [Thermoplasmata archaeon]
MAFLFGPSLAERSQLVRTIHSLGPTSIDGLAAALSWSTRKTERLVTTLARRGEAGIWYAPYLRQVRIGPPPPDPDPAALLPPLAPPEEAIRPAERSRAGAPSVQPTPALPTRRVSGRKCPNCSGSLEMMGDNESLVCPRCGRLSLAPRPAGTTDAPGGGAGPNPTQGALGDRRSQEMLAAYVTARPIPCPRCRGPLRHQGLGTFRCPSCGEAVTFPRESPTVSPPPLPAAAAPRAR